MEHLSPATLRYLTVQDILWIDLQVTGVVRPFRYAELEEAASYQYAYGSTNDLLAQAGRLVTGFLKLAPLEGANEATGLLACFGFLMLNGLSPTLPDSEGSRWFEKVRSEAVQPQRALEMVFEPSAGHAPGTVEEAVRTLLSMYPETIEALRQPIPSASV